MERLLGHRQTKEAATDKPNLMPPRHISTPPSRVGGHRQVAGVTYQLSQHFEHVVVPDRHELQAERHSCIARVEIMEALELALRFLFGGASEFQFLRNGSPHALRKVFAPMIGSSAV
jgi:hypothetical protein